MNPYNNLILLNDEDKTEDIEKIEHSKGGFSIRFKNSAKFYNYNNSKVSWLSKPKELNVDNYMFHHKGKKLYNIVNVLKFNIFYKFFFKNDKKVVINKSELKIIESTLTNKKSSDHMKYFKELSEYISLKTDEGESLMKKKLDAISFVRSDSCLASYLNPGKYKLRSYEEKQMIFPFGCNSSQKIAVRNAMENSMSVIEGPPGTGKTQTILNIIANILFMGKTVAVVSNNNAATINVLEKLEKYGLDFIAAFLGNSENKKNFIENQSVDIERIESVDKDKYDELLSNERELSSSIDDMLDKNNTLALNRQNIKAFEFEMKRYDKYYKDTFDDIIDIQLKEGISSNKLMKLWVKYIQSRNVIDKNKIPFLRILYYSLVFGFRNYKFFNQPVEQVISLVQKEYYRRKHVELSSEIDELGELLDNYNFADKLDELSDISMKILKTNLANKYINHTRKEFSSDDLWKNSYDVLSEYPVIMSTTFSITSSLNKETMYDYVIVDEASQVDLLTGVLAMSCAKNMVVVGDQMQLPNVMPEGKRKIADMVGKKYSIEECYRFENNSMLKSIISRFEEIPKILLKEHYRCHPKIIQFCNQKFYKNELIIMTEDNDEADVLKVYKTVKGSHARGRVNQRQIDEITKSILPELGAEIDSNNVGIISPYRNQKYLLESNLECKGIEIDTVHKFQGREKDNIIITTVDNEISKFTDDPNMLNVAISRAKKKIRIVVSESEGNEDTNIGDFIRYIKFNNFEVSEGRVFSVFDLLYKEYSNELIQFMKESKNVSRYNSENIMNALMNEVLDFDEFSSFGYVMQFPLKMILNNLELLEDEEVKYAMNIGTHVDFLIFRKIDRSPVLAVEVDGYSFHKKGTRQAERDQLKNSILRKYEIPIVRFNTTGSNEEERLIKELRWMPKL
jgi:superfamily I DNA and/or RNA helicase